MTTNLRIVIAGPVSLDDESGLQPSIADALWIDVPAGSTKSPGDGEEFLSCDTSGAQTTINLRAAAVANDGEIQLIKCNGNMLSPIIVNAGAGTTVELLNTPGTYGASTWIPIQGQSVFFKYDKATTQWKMWASERGNGTPGTSAFNPGFYAAAAIYVDPQNVSTTARDSNSGTSAATALRTYAEVVRRWGSVTTQYATNFTLNFLSSHIDGTDPLVWMPQQEANAKLILQGATPTTTAAVFTLVASKNQAAGTNSPLIGSFSAGVPVVGTWVRNTTAGKESRAYIYKSAGGANWIMTQPIALQTPGTGVLTEIDTWATNDTVVLEVPVKINVVRLAPSFVENGGFSIFFAYQFDILDPSGIGKDTLAIADAGGGQGNVIFQEVSIERVATFGVSRFQSIAYNCFFTGGVLFVGPAVIVGGAFPQSGASVSGNCTPAQAPWFDGDCIIGRSGAALPTGIFGRVFLDVSITIGGFTGPGPMIVSPLFYATAVIYGSAAPTIAIQGNCRLNLLTGGTWASAITLATAIATGIKLNGATTASTHTGANPDIINTGVTTTVANADAAFGGTMFNLGGASMSKAA